MHRLILLGMCVILLCGALSAPAAHGDVAVSDAALLNAGWRLWLDPQASWENDALYLPDQVNLAALPVNPPTGGWQQLSDTAGISVSLPATVEQYYWGQSPAKQLSGNNVVDGDGSYHGVSWWFHPFTPPALGKGERLVFSFPGARLRAEVYVNSKLVAYNLVGETAFEADATDAVIPGQPNLLAVRITNPGGERGWGDFSLMSWGKYRLPITHTAGGLDGGVTMAVRGPVCVSDIAALNNPDPKTITLVAQVKSTGPAYDGPVALAIRSGDKTVWSGSADIRVDAGATAAASKTVTIKSARLWDIGQPNLYIASASIPSEAHSDRSTTFGFRWFTAKGVGSNAMLTLNGRRIVVKSAISWGWWAPNGMFPDEAAAERDVASVKALGLNCIQNHRHMPKPVALNAFDHAGLMWFCEPGGGCMTYNNDPGVPPYPAGPVDTSGNGGEPSTFYNRYEEYKVLSMIKTDRSHPSVIVWNLQNEAVVGLNNPKLFYTLRKMRDADPSRIIVSQSGIPRNDEAWMLPYSSDIKAEPGSAAGWADAHTAGDSRGVYQDLYYVSPTQYKYYTTDAQDVSMWGEMATGASPDDHGKIDAWYRRQGIPGYDEPAHKAVIAGYNAFLDAYGFRAAFPTCDDVFRDAADMHYFIAARMLENARICDNNDYLALSGWESTIVDNHSGLVDELRNVKTDPTPVREAAAPAAIVLEPRRMVLAKGDSAVVDVHLVNENVLRGKYRLSVTASDSSGTKIASFTEPVKIAGGDIFAQLLKDNISFACSLPGYVTIAATLSRDSGAPALARTARLYVVDTQPVKLRNSVAVLGAKAFADAIKTKFNVEPVELTPATPHVDTIVIDPAVGPRSAWTWSTTPDHSIDAPRNRGVFTQQAYGDTGPVAHFDNLSNGLATVELYFVEPFFKQAGKRVFDVALNGAVVLTDFDIFKEAGAVNRPVVKTFQVPVTDGNLDLSVPRVSADHAMFAAIRIVDSNGVNVRRLFGTHDYHDATNQRWLPIDLAGFDWNTVTPDIWKRVREDGSRLVFVSNDMNAADVAEAAKELARQNLVKFNGMLGDSNAPWMGRWYFGKDHWLLSGLPTNCVFDWPYQISGGNGVRIEGPGIEGVVGYGINHAPDPGLGCAIIPCGKGQVVLYCIPGLAPSFITGAPRGIDPITATRMIYNCLAGPVESPILSASAARSIR